MRLVPHRWGQLSVYRYSGHDPDRLLQDLRGRITEVSNDFRCRVSAGAFYTLGATDLLVVSQFNSPQLFDASLLLPGQRTTRSEGFQVIDPGPAGPGWVVLDHLADAARLSQLPVTAVFSLRLSAVAMLLRPPERSRTDQVLELVEDVVYGLGARAGVAIAPLLGLDRSDLFLVVQAATLRSIAELEQGLSGLEVSLGSIQVPSDFHIGTLRSTARLFSSVQVLIGMIAGRQLPDWISPDHEVGSSVRATSLVRWEPDAEHTAKHAFLSPNAGRVRIGGGRVLVRWPLGPGAQSEGPPRMSAAISVSALEGLFRRPQEAAPRVFQDTSIQLLDEDLSTEMNGAPPGELWTWLSARVEALADCVHHADVENADQRDSPDLVWTRRLRAAAVALRLPWGLKHELRDLTIRMAMLLDTEAELAAVGLPVVAGVVALMEEACGVGLANREARVRLQGWGLLRTTATALDAILSGGAAPGLLDHGHRSAPSSGPQCGALLAIDAICGLTRLAASVWGIRSNPIVYFTIDPRPWVTVGPAGALLVQVPTSDRLEPFDLGLAPGLSTAVLDRVTYFDLQKFISGLPVDALAARTWATALADAHDSLSLRVRSISGRRSLLQWLRDIGDRFVEGLPSSSEVLPLAHCLRQLSASLPALLGSAPAFRNFVHEGKAIFGVHEADEERWFFEAGPRIVRETIARGGEDRVSMAALGVLLASSLLQATRTMPGETPVRRGWLAADLAHRLRWACMSESAHEDGGGQTPGAPDSVLSTLSRLVALQQDLGLGGERFIAELRRLLVACEALETAEAGTPEHALAMKLGAWHAWVQVWATDLNRAAGCVALGQWVCGEVEIVDEPVGLAALGDAWSDYLSSLRGEGAPWMVFADIAELEDPEARKRIVERLRQRRFSHERVLLRTGGRSSVNPPGRMQDAPPPESDLMRAAARLGGRHLLAPLLGLLPAGEASAAEG